jgi:glycosyltransferase involved in cell wall biosynthesis
MSGNKKLSIILPIFNPHENWEHYLNSSFTKLTQLFSGINFEIIIVNDGSTIKINDSIEKIITQYNNIRYLCYSENKGKGHAVRYGTENSDSDYYIYTDYDFPFGCNAIVETYNLLQTNKCDLVFGKRNKTYYGILPFKRHIISKCLLFANYIMLGFKPIDTQAGLKGFNKGIKHLLLSTKANGYTFEFEFIRKCVKNNCKIIPVHISVDENIKLSDFRFKVIFRELKIYIKLLFKR